jgi:hypothetical protein
VTRGEIRLRSRWNFGEPAAVPRFAFSGTARVHQPEHLFVPFAETGSDDVLADYITPQIVTAIASRMVARDEIHPVYSISTDHFVAAVANGLALELHASLHAAHLNFRFVRLTHSSLCNSSILTV